MRPIRLLPLVIAIIAAFLATPGPAWAGRRNEPILADFNGDGLVDRATLGQVGTTRKCVVDVADGRPDRTFADPFTHTYLSIEVVAPFCPDMGEAINLGVHGELELVLDGFNEAGGKLMVLKDFQPIGFAQGLSFPGLIHTADFNGDERTDLFEWTNQFNRGLLTLINNPDGTLTPGPFAACSILTLPNYVLADYNGDGGDDMLLFNICYQTRPSTTARVYFGNGQPPVTLMASDQTSARWEVYSFDYELNGVPDAGVLERRDGMIIDHRFKNDGNGNFFPLL